MDDSARCKVKEEILDILRNSDDMLRTFRTQIENKYVIIFVGNTRNGKSTLVNYITDTPLVAFQEGNLFKIQTNGTNQGATIGQGSLSHTTVPTILEMRGRPDTVIVDAPGFDDNRGAVQEIINALYINQIKYSKGVRFVLVCDINNIINDNINYFLSFIETVHTIMPDFAQLKEAVSIIFTKDWKQYGQAEIVELLKIKILDVEGLRCKKELIKHFVERPALVGLFKMPGSAGPLTKEIDVNVNDAIFGSLPVNLHESDIRFGISTNARIVLLETYLDFFDVLIMAREIFKGFRTLASDKFCFLSKDKLILLTSEQLQGKTSSANQIMIDFYKHIKRSDWQLNSLAQIPDSLQQLFIDEVAKVAVLVESIGIQVPVQVATKFNSHTIEEVRKKLEYISCIEKVVEKDNKSQELLACYRDTTKTFCNEIQGIGQNIREEVEKRKILTTKIKSVPNIEDNLRRLDELYLFASSKDELLKMKLHLESYLNASNKVTEDVSKRPELQRSSIQDIYRTTSVYNNIENKIRIIQRHINNRNSEEILKNVPPQIKSLMGTLMLYTSVIWIRSFSGANQLKIVAGSFLLFAVYSWKSVYMRKQFLRLRRRYEQGRMFRSRTQLDGCCNELMSSETESKYF